MLNSLEIAKVVGVYPFTLEQLEKLMFFLAPYDIDKDDQLEFHYHALTPHPCVTFCDRDNMIYTLVWDNHKENWNMIDIQKYIQKEVKKYEDNLKFRFRDPNYCDIREHYDSDNDI